VKYPWMLAHAMEYSIRIMYYVLKVSLGGKVHEDILETVDEPCCLETMRRIMKDKGLRSTRGRKFVITTDSNNTMPVAKNILNRDFEAGPLNQKWVANITYIPTHQG